MTTPQKAAKDMTDHELATEIRLLTQNSQKTNEILEKLVESDIRRQERDTRQEEFNSRTTADIKELKEWKREIEIQRSAEARGIDTLSKYWWVLLLLGAFVAYHVTNGSISLPNK